MSYKLADGSLSTDYEIGDRFIIIGSELFGDGSVVSLYDDDGSDCPLFKFINGSCDYNCCDGEKGAYAWWSNLKSIDSIYPLYTINDEKSIKADTDLSQFITRCQKETRIINQDLYTALHKAGCRFKEEE